MIYTRYNHGHETHLWAHARSDNIRIFIMRRMARQKSGNDLPRSEFHEGSVVQTTEGKKTSPLVRDAKVTLAAMIRRLHDCRARYSEKGSWQFPHHRTQVSLIAQ